MPVINMSGDEKQLWMSMQKIIVQGEKHEDVLKKITQAANSVASTYDSVGQKGEKAFGGAGKSVEQYAAQMAKLEGQLKKGTISQETFGRASEAAHQKLTGSMEKSQGGLEKHVATLGKMAIGYLSVQKGIEAVTAALKDKEEFENKMASRTTSVAEAQSKMLRNLAAETAADQERAIMDVEGLAKKNVIKGGLRTAYDVYTSALTATSSDPTRSKEIADVAMQTAPDSPGEAAQTASTLGDLEKMTKTREAMKNLGFLIGIGKLSRVKNFDDIGKNLGKAMVGSAGYGGSSVEVGAMTVAFNQAMLDETGRESGTTQIAMAEQLKDFLPEKDTYQYKDPADVTAEDQAKGVTFTPDGRAMVLKRKGTGFTTTDQRRAHLMQKGNEALRDEFFSTASFEKKGIVPARQFLGLDGGLTGRLYEDAKKVIVAPEKAAGLAEAQLKLWASPYEQQVAKQTWDRENQGDRFYKTMQGREAAVAAGFQADAMDAFMQGAGVGYFETGRLGLSASRFLDVNIGRKDPKQWAKEQSDRAVRAFRFTDPVAASSMGVMSEAEGKAAGIGLTDTTSRSVANSIEDGMKRAMALSENAQKSSDEIGTKQLEQLNGIRQSLEKLTGSNPTLGGPDKDK